MAGQLEKLLVKIPNGAAVSGFIDLSSRRLVALQAPAAWTAARLTVVATTHRDPVVDTGAPLVPVAAPAVDSALGGIGSGTDAGAGTLIVVADAAALAVSGRMLIFSSTLRDQLAALRHVQFRSTNAASAAAVNQGGDRYLWATVEPRGV